MAEGFVWGFGQPIGEQEREVETVRRFHRFSTLLYRQLIQLPGGRYNAMFSDRAIPTGGVVPVLTCGKAVTSKIRRHYMDYSNGRDLLLKMTLGDAAWPIVEFEYGDFFCVDSTAHHIAVQFIYDWVHCGFQGVSKPHWMNLRRFIARLIQEKQFLYMKFPFAVMPRAEFSIEQIQESLGVTNDTMAYYLREGIGLKRSRGGSGHRVRLSALQAVQLMQWLSTPASGKRARNQAVAWLEENSDLVTGELSDFASSESEQDAVESESENESESG